MNGDIGKLPSGAVYPATPEPLAVTASNSEFSGTLNGVADSLETYVQASTPPGGSLPDPSPGSDAGIPLDQLKQMLSSQLEYYFSRENLANDAYLLSQMDNDQYVPIWTVANFNQVKKLTKDIKLITEVLRESPNVQVDEEGIKVRPNHKRCIVILREIPDNTPLEEVKALFSGEGCPRLISCEFAHNNSWYVTFESDEDAQKAYRFLREEVREFQGKPIMARIKAKPMNRLPIPPVSAMGAAVMKNGYRNPPTAMYDPNTYQGQQRFLYSNGSSMPPNVNYGNQVQIYAFQHQQPFYPPSMLQPWPPAGPGFVELGSVFSFNGLAPQASFSKPQGSRAYNPRNRNKRNQPMNDRASLSEVMNLGRHSANSHSYHLGGMGSSVTGSMGGTQSKNSNSASGNNSSVGGKIQTMASVGVINDVHHNHSKTHQPSSHDASDATSVPSQNPGPLLRGDSEDYRQSRDLTSKEPMPPRHRRRRKDEEVVSTGRPAAIGPGKPTSSGSPQPANRESVIAGSRGPLFDLEATAFPPLPGMDNGIGVNTRNAVPVENVTVDASNSHWENRLSDVVKGTAKAKCQNSCTSTKDKDLGNGGCSGSPRATTPTSPIQKALGPLVETKQTIYVQHNSQQQSSQQPLQLPQSQMQQQQTTMPLSPSPVAQVPQQLPLQVSVPAPQVVPHLTQGSQTQQPVLPSSSAHALVPTSQQRQTSHNSLPLAVTSANVTENETKEVGTGNDNSLSSFALTPPHSPDKTVPVAAKVMADKSTKTDDSLLSSDVVGGGQSLNPKTGEGHNSKLTLPTTPNEVLPTLKPVPTTTNAATMTSAVVVSDVLSAPARLTATTSVMGTVSAPSVLPCSASSSASAEPGVNSITAGSGCSTPQIATAATPAVSSTTATSSSVESSGATTRLSYAQVAQHHKEKVERMLREKQSIEQEKEKKEDRDRKRESAMPRVSQHGDLREPIQREFKDATRYLGMGRGRPGPSYERQDRGIGVRRREMSEKVSRYRDVIRPRSPK